MNRLAACALLVAIALGSSPGEGRPRRARPLSRKQCDQICVRMVACAGLPLGQSSTLAEVLICHDDCVFESKDNERRAWWLCAARADGCAALRACDAGAKTPPPDPLPVVREGSNR